MCCETCHHRNRPGTMFCEECGCWLLGDHIPQQPETHRLIEFGDPNAAAEGKCTSLTLRLPEFSETIVMHGVERVIMGRCYPEDSMGRQKTPTAVRDVDLDLSPYGAVEMGVSRYHATFEVDAGQTRLLDMHSSNGTFLNGKRLIPDEPTTVHSGDEIRLGRLVATVYLQ